jgi:hypothetical protein
MRRHAGNGSRLQPPGLRGYKRTLRGYRRGFGPAVARAWAARFSERCCPAKNLHISAGIFDKGAAAFNPVSVVEVEDIADLADFGMVDMAAHHPVDAAGCGLARHDLLEAEIYSTAFLTLCLSQADSDQ